MTAGRLCADDAVRHAAATAKDPRGAVARWKALSGAKAVGCLPLYLPEEVLHAAGMLPVTVWGDEFPEAPPTGLPAFLCGVVRGAVSSIRRGLWDGIDAWAIPSTCDSIQNAVEVLKAGGEERPVFPLVFPLSGDLPGAPEYLLDRIEAFVEWAGEVSGRGVTEGALDKAIAACNANRRLFAQLEGRLAEAPRAVRATEFLQLARAGSLMPKEAHSEIIRAVLAERRGTGPPPRARVFLAGMMATEDVGRALDGAGAALVGDDLGRGRRYYDGEVAEGGDAAVALVRRHLSRGPCATLYRAGSSGADALFGRIAACGADRVLVVRVRQCEPEGGDVPDIAAAAKSRGLPFMAVEIDAGGRGGGAPLAGRIAAFVEMGD